MVEGPALPPQKTEKLEEGLFLRLQAGGAWAEGELGLVEQFKKISQTTCVLLALPQLAITPPLALVYLQTQP